jgi:hypothetical protein
MDTWLRLSCILYRHLLAAYPPEFRRLYGAEMEQVFRDGCREALRMRGAAGLVGYWLHVLCDLARTACVERWAAMDRRSAGLSLLAFAMGLLTGYIDFHATEVQATVGVLLIFTFIFGFASPRQTWRWALCIGIGVPLLHILNSLLRLPPPYPVEPNILGTFIALIPAFIGAYCGVFARRLFTELLA